MLLTVLPILLQHSAAAQDSVRVLQSAPNIDSALQSFLSSDAADTNLLEPEQDLTSWIHITLNTRNTSVIYFPSDTVLEYRVYSFNSAELIDEYTAPSRSPDYIDWNPSEAIPIAMTWGPEFVMEIKLSRQRRAEFQLLSFDEYQLVTSPQLINNGLLYGALVLMVAFCFFLYIANKDNHAGRLGITLTIWFFALLSIWGYGTSELPLGLSELLPAITNQIIIIASFSAACFSIYFLKDSLQGSKALLALKINAIACVVYIGFTIVFEVSWFASIWLLIVASIVNLSANAIATLRGDKAAGFLLASSLLSSSPYFFVTFSPVSQQTAIAIGLASLALVMTALMQRMAEQFHDLSLKAKLAGERERFLATMSHEIRTPLNGIIGFSELANQEKLSGKLKTYFNHIDRSSKMLLGIVNEVLDYAKLQADEVNLSIDAMNIKETLEDVIAISHPIAEKNSIALSYEIADDLPQYISTDAHRCSQILINLCGNAVKFSKNGNVTIRVSKTNDEILFKVVDDGIGIEDEVLAGLFNPFSQADASTARHYGGTGLGLAISKQLCHLLGGSLSAVSESGIGSTFTLHLPYVEASPPALIKQSNTESLRGKRVLLAEDNVVNMLLATQILENHGMETDPATDGKIALEKASANHYDFILMDMQMPELSGTEATQQIRKLGIKHPIIAMTANTAESDREACMDAGMNDYLPKPIEQQQLLKKLEQWSSLNPS